MYHLESKIGSVRPTVRAIGPENCKVTVVTDTQTDVEGDRHSTHFYLDSDDEGVWWDRTRTVRHVLVSNW